MKFPQNIKVGFFILTLLAIIIVIFIFLVLHIDWSHTYADIFEANWDIRLPAGISEVYSEKGDIDFQGHGARYAAYKTSRSLDGSSLLKEASWEKNVETEKRITDILEKIGADKDNYPDFSKNYTWKLLTKNNRKLYIVYDTSAYLLYLIQDE